MSFRAGFVGIIGLPNAGKSSLVNYLVGEKVSIVTQKPQTTRRRVVGLLTSEESQLLLVDAPGLVRGGKGLNKFLERELLDIISSSDVLLAVLNVDAEKPEDLEKIISMCANSRKPWIPLIHKVDLPLNHRPPMISELLPKSVEALRLSSKFKLEDEKQTLVDRITSLLPESPAPLYDPEIISLENIRALCAELIREQCFEKLHQEIPFGLAVRVLKFDETEGKTPKIHAEIIVGREKHKPIVIGKAGANLKAIGTAARTQIEKLMQQKVYLELFVKAKSKWEEDSRFMEELGYVTPESK